MKRVIIGMTVAVLFTVGLLGQSQTAPFYSYNVDSVTVAGTSIGFTSATILPSGQIYRADLMQCVVKCSTTSPCRINIRADGQAATNITGDELNEGDRFSVYWYTNIRLWRAIRNGANDAIVRCTVWRKG